jgi:cathepsin X
VLGYTFGYQSEVWTREQEDAAGIIREDYYDPLPHEYLADSAVPDEFTWCNKDGVNYCTMSRNQHLPQYCGSCWAHGAVSALADRIKIARGAKGTDINLSVQHILNCANVGSCHGGSVPGVYQWLKATSRSGTGLSYETSQPYLACSSESNEGFCGSVDTTCKPINIARTCSTFASNGGFCSELLHYPNVTIDQYGTVGGFFGGAASMQKEIYARGPISCGIDAEPLLEYQNGIISTHSFTTNHVVSVVGWGVEGSTSYWIVRNSWGEYWGEAGYVKVAFGALNLQAECAWATVKDFTAPERNNQYHCYEDGSNCV